MNTLFMSSIVIGEPSFDYGYDHKGRFCEGFLQQVWEDNCLLSPYMSPELKRAQVNVT